MAAAEASSPAGAGPGSERRPIGAWPGALGHPPRRATGGSGGGASRAVCAMSGGPPKALPSTGPHSLRDMPHPLAGSSSEEAVGGDSTPSPDLLMARSFGDKVGRAGLGTGRLIWLQRGMVDPEPPSAPGRAHPGALSRGWACARPQSLRKERLLSAAPAGSQLQGERSWGTGMLCCDWSCAPVTAGGEGSRLRVGD